MEGPLPLSLQPISTARRLPVAPARAAIVGPRVPLKLQFQILTWCAPPANPATWDERSLILRTLAKVDRNWRHICRFFLASGPVLRREESAWAFLAGVSCNATLAGNVKRLWIGSYDGYAFDDGSNLLALFLLFCPNLERVTVTGVLKVNLSLFPRMPRLLRLELICCSFDRLPTQVWYRPQARLQALTHLAIVSHERSQATLDIGSSLGLGPITMRGARTWRALLSLCRGGQLRSFTTDEGTDALFDQPGLLTHVASPIIRDSTFPVALLRRLEHLSPFRAGHEWPIELSAILATGVATLAWWPTGVRRVTVLPRIASGPQSIDVIMSFLDEAVSAIQVELDRIARDAAVRRAKAVRAAQRQLIAEAGILFYAHKKAVEAWHVHAKVTALKKSVSIKTADLRQTPSPKKRVVSAALLGVRPLGAVTPIRRVSQPQPNQYKENRAL